MEFINSQASAHAAAWGFLRDAWSRDLQPQQVVSVLRARHRLLIPLGVLQHYFAFLDAEYRHSPEHYFESAEYRNGPECKCNGADRKVLTSEENETWRERQSQAIARSAILDVTNDDVLSNKDLQRKRMHL